MSNASAQQQRGIRFIVDVPIRLVADRRLPCARCGGYIEPGDVGVISTDDLSHADGCPQSWTPTVINGGNE